MSDRIILMLLPALQFAVGLLLAWRFWNRIGAKTCIVYYVLRTVLLFSVLPYMISKVPPDVRVWMTHAEWMTDLGLFPDVGFPTAYQLGFNFLLWLSYKVWHNPYSIMLTFNVFDCVSIPFMYAAFRELYNEKSARRIVILFITSPCCWLCSFWGQDEPVVCCFTMAALWMLVRNRLALAAVYAFLCYAFTKALAPMYFAFIFLRARWKGVAAVALAVGVYCVISLCFGINPFDFRSAVTLDQAATSIADNGYVRGSVWYYFKPVPEILQYGTILAVLVAVGLMFVKTLWNDECDEKTRLQIACVLTAVFAFDIFAFFRLCYEAYMLPFLPVMIASFLKLEVKRRYRLAALVVFLGWVMFFMRKEPRGQSFLSSVSYVLDTIVYIGYVVFPAVLLYGYRKYLTTPWAGIRILPKVFGFRKAS